MTQLLIKPKKDDSQDRLTSELIFLGGEETKNELNRRLVLLGLAPEQSAKFVEEEEKILQSAGGLGPNPWFQHRFIINSTRKESLPDPKNLTASEIVALVDDANAAGAYDHEWLPAAAFEAVGYAKGRAGEPSPYIAELNSRMAALGLGEWQFGSFVINECLILARLKWKISAKRAWQESTMLKKNTWPAHTP